MVLDMQYCTTSSQMTHSRNETKEQDLKKMHEIQGGGKNFKI